MKVNAIRVTYCYEHFTTFYIHSEETDKCIDSFDCVNSNSSRIEFMKYAEANGWEVTRIIKV